MKIQTQAWLLVAGIVLAPLLILLINLMYQLFFIDSEIYGLPTHEDIITLVDDNVSAAEWESITRQVAFSRNRGEVAVFRDDYFVLYSTIPGFNPGEYSNRESIVLLIEADSANGTSDYNFASRNLRENRVYILTERTPFSSGPRWPPYFVPVILLIIILTVFTICMSIVITRTITHSIQVLERATRHIAEGELDFDVNVKGNNEITSLTNSLKKMRDALKEEELKRSRFIMGITHDLKTPLALIKGYAEAIEDGITEDTVSRSSAAEIIAVKADQLEGMIVDLINYVRMETGEWREQLVELPISTFINNLVKTMSMDVELMDHEFTADINLPENLSVPMDDRLVQRAMENLIYNAVRHTPRGSSIHVKAVLVQDAVELTIADNGPGMDSKDIPHIFEMFYRGSLSRREQGMGLGLAVVKWVADYHGWSISVAADKGKGTCFTILIPIGKIPADYNVSS